MMLSVGIFVFFLKKDNSQNNSKTLIEEARNIEGTISDSFEYTNQINSHIGRQIAQSGATDLKFILKLLCEADKIKHRNSDLFSWSAFDWVNDKNYQTVNSKLGIHKNPPDMSSRQYTNTSRQNPWTLQVSFPSIGIPSNSWVIPAGTGVVDKNQKYLGLVVVGFDIAELTSKVSQRINQKVRFVVLDNELRVILKSTGVDLTRDSTFFQSNFDKKIFNEKEGILAEKIRVGDVSFTHYEKFSKYPYIALVGFDEDFLKKQFSYLILPRLLEFFCATIFFLLTLYLFEIKVTSLLLAEKKLLKRYLKKANEAKDRILFSISHDIKNYIFGIGGLGRSVIDSKNKSEILGNKDLQIIETICEQAEELYYFVEDLLDTSHIEAGGLTLGNLKEADIQALINAVLMISKGLIANHRVVVKTDIENKIPKFTCDPRRMKQIFANLITNAVKYSKSQGEISITAKNLQETNQLYIEIADQGFGMDEEEIKKYLSGKGNKIDKSEIAKLKAIDSHGIGMPIVFRLVELHHGKIEVESKKEVGTKIRLYFDLSGFGKKNNEQKTNAKNKSILLVEDNPVNIKVTCKTLQKEGYEILHVENGKEALEILDKENFDLILMDGEMPVMNGYEATKAIRQGLVFKNFKNYKTIPIIALMSSADEKTIKRAIDSGMNEHIEKSASKTKLLDAIERLLKS